MISFLLASLIGLDIVGPSSIGPYRMATFVVRQPVEGSRYLFDVWPMLESDQVDEHEHFVKVVAPPGRYTVVVTELPKGEGKVRVRKTFDILPADPGPGPQPPGPTPPGPTPPPSPAPIPEPGFRVLIVYESGQMTQYPLETQIILAGADVRDFLQKNTVVVGGVPEFRIYDADIDVSHDSAIWQKAMARPRSQIPWVLISNGTTGYEGPLPKTPSEFLELCKKYLPTQ